jgi:hypothetical protein
VLQADLNVLRIDGECVLIKHEATKPWACPKRPQASASEKSVPTLHQAQVIKHGAKEPQAGAEVLQSPQTSVKHDP